MMDLSIVIPLLNEQDSIEELFQRIKTVCIENNFTFEVIFIDEASGILPYQITSGRDRGDDDDTSNGRGDAASS